MQSQYYKKHKTVSTPQLNLFMNVRLSTNDAFPDGGCYTLYSGQPLPHSTTRLSVQGVLVQNSLLTLNKQQQALLGALRAIPPPGFIPSPAALTFSLQQTIQVSHPFCSFQREALLSGYKKEKKIRYSLHSEETPRMLFNSLCTTFPFINSLRSSTLDLSDDLTS